MHGLQLVVKIEAQPVLVDAWHEPTKAKTDFNKLKVVRIRKGEIDLAVERIQRCLCMVYSEMSRLDLGLVVHTLNVDPEAKLVA